MRPRLEEIEATVERLEARLAVDPDHLTQSLLAAYHKLDARFRADLADPRDLALSRGAALMLIKFSSELR
jgi:hypothetical protein